MIHVASDSSHRFSPLSLLRAAPFLSSLSHTVTWRLLPLPPFPPVSLLMPRLRSKRAVSHVIATLFLLLIVICSAPSHALLDVQEQDALAELLSVFPALSNVPQYWRRSFVGTSVPANWPSNFSSICSGADGYDLYGIRCAAGHVDQILWCVHTFQHLVTP